MLTFFGACKKVSRRQAKPPAAAPEATDMHPKHSHIYRDRHSHEKNDISGRLRIPANLNPPPPPIPRGLHAKIHPQTALDLPGPCRHRTDRQRRHNPRLLLRSQPRRLRPEPIHQRHRLRRLRRNCLQPPHPIPARRHRHRTRPGDQMGRLQRRPALHLPAARRGEIPHHRLLHPDPRLQR